MNLLTKKNAPPLGSHVFQANVTIFEHIQDIIETNHLTKFHEDWTKNVASRDTTDNARRTKGDHVVRGGYNIRLRGGYNGVGYNGRGVGRLSSDNHLVDGPTDRPT
ncbi:hypothetical protein DPMN_065050 [Dreissena polymorpha]|uniref:Uncharacterized protein n=1 Tax=Dreissena polymorpha TaxID=45954 RepID=A0A9D4CER3_DREPO|nr:hypothetical protein DPMN_065050 [Dreissena polymorpha]